MCFIFALCVFNSISRWCESVLFLFNLRRESYIPWIWSLYSQVWNTCKILIAHPWKMLVLSSLGVRTKNCHRESTSQCNVHAVTLKFIIYNNMAICSGTEFDNSGILKNFTTGGENCYGSTLLRGPLLVLGSPEQLFCHCGEWLSTSGHICSPKVNALQKARWSIVNCLPVACLIRQH